MAQGYERVAIVDRQVTGRRHGEVLPDAAPLYEDAAAVGENARFASVLGTTGGADRMLVVYDSQRFRLIGSEELDEIDAAIAEIETKFFFARDLYFDLEAVLS